MEHPGDIDLLQILRVLRRQLWLIIGIALVTLLGATAVILKLPHLYTGEAIVVLNSRSSKIADLRSALAAPLSGLQSDAAVIRTEIETLTAPAMLERVITEKHLVDNPAFNPVLRQQQAHQPGFFGRLAGRLHAVSARLFGRHAAAPEEAPPLDGLALTIQHVQKNLSVTNDGGSYLLRIRFTDRDPYLAAEVANGFAEIYLRDQQNMKLAAAHDSVQWLGARMLDLREKVITGDRELAKFRNEHNLKQTSGMTLLDQRTAEVNSQVTAASSDVNRAAANLREVEALAKNPSRTSAANPILNSPLIQSLREQEASLQRQEADLSTRYLDRHPAMRQIRAQRHDIQRKIGEEIQKIVDAAKRDYDAARAREAGLKQQLATLEQQRGNQASAEVQMSILERDAAANRTLYASYLEKYKELSEQEHSQDPDARLLSPARPPLHPSFPKYQIILPAALLASFGLAVCIALVLAWFHKGVISVEALEDLGPIRSLGLIPEIRRRDRPLELLTRNPRSRYPEAVQSVCAALQCLDHRTRPRVLLVTSSVPGEGKSVLAASLARGMVLAGNRALLIDCDLRRPTVAKLFNARGVTMSAVLAGAAEPSDLVATDRETGLDYIAVEKEPTSIQAVLSSDRFRSFVHAARDAYDYVIIDTPPLLAVSDALLISTIADATLLAVRWEQTPQMVVRNALKLLRDNNIPLLGFLLTRVNMRKHARYSYGDSAYLHAKYSAYYK